MTAGRTEAWFAALRAERQAQCALLRDIVGNPYRPLSPIPPGCLSWSGGTVRRLASSIYEERAFERLPILADALEEAGCADVGLLAHLRGSEPHARGCHVVNAILGKR
jgi:hypothetical protein